MKIFGTIAFGLFVSFNLHAASNQGFENNIIGISSVLAPGESPGPNLTRVASGGVNVPASTSSQGGAYFAEVAMGDGIVSVQGDRIIWNDGSYSGGFVSGDGFTVDVFFDDPFFYSGGELASSVIDGFFFQPTILNDGNVGAVNGGGFGARIFDTGGVGDFNDYVWRVGADGDVKGYSGTSTFHEISSASSGWYTMSTIWETNPLSVVGDINQVNTLTRISTGSVVYSETIEDAVAAGQAGAIGAASIGSGDLGTGGPISIFGDLGIDNVSGVPEPSAFALIFGVVGLSLAACRRRR